MYTQYKYNEANWHITSIVHRQFFNKKNSRTIFNQKYFFTTKKMKTLRNPLKFAGNSKHMEERLRYLNGQSNCTIQKKNSQIKKLA